METPQDALMKIAQQINKELASEPLHNHATIVNLVTILCQHRATVEKHKMEEQMQRDQFAAQVAMGNGPRPVLV